MSMSRPVRRLEIYQPHHQQWRPARYGVAALGKRELEIVHLLALAKTTNQIAAELGISVKTVRTHWCRAKEKLGVPDITTLVHFALARGLISNLYANEPNG